MNTDTHFHKAYVVCELGHVLIRFVAQTCARREQVGAQVPIYISKIKNAHEKDARFEELTYIQWGKAAIFSYLLCMYDIGEYVVIDSTLAFG